MSVHTSPRSRRSDSGLSFHVRLCCRIIPNVSALKIKREKISKQDVAFMKKVFLLTSLLLFSKETLEYLEVILLGQ